jgi:hypothetical protein
MSHHDLLQNIRELSVQDPVVAADIIDLCCFSSARTAGSLTVLICDSGGRLIQPVRIDDVPRRCPPAAASRALFAPLLQFADELNGGLVVAVGRPGGLIDDDDRRWHQIAIEECRRAGVRLFGMFVATPDRVVRLPDPDPLPAAI